MTDTPFPLGRHVNHDPRSRQYPFAARPEAAAPIKSVLWNRRVPIFDQGRLSSCTGNAAAGWVATDNNDRAGRTITAAGPVDEAFAVRLYSRATHLDPFDGAYPPDDTGSDGLSVAKALRELGLVGEYTHCFGLGDVLTALQTGPVLAGTNWYDGMFWPDSRGTVTPSGDITGGHEYLIVGVDVDLQEVVFAQSWGPDWGDRGYGRMTYATLRRLLAEQGDATVVHATADVEPGPVVPPFYGKLAWLRTWLRGWFEWLTRRA